MSFGSQHAGGNAVSRSDTSAEQKRRRAELLPKAYNTPCPRCGLLMLKGQALDLGHTIDHALRPGLAGDRIEHRSCNRRAGAATRDALAKYRAGRRYR